MFRTAFPPCILLVIVGLMTTERGQAAGPPLPDPEKIKDRLVIASKYLQADATNRDRDPAPGRMIANPAIRKLVKGVGKLPEGDNVRRQTVALARKYARVAELRKSPDPGPIYNHQAHTRLYFSWGVLLETRVLRGGLSLEEATALLGRPTSIRGREVEWCYRSRMHVNPCLRCSLGEDQRLGEFKIVNK
jgi:hypothetical protein